MGGAGKKRSRPGEINRGSVNQGVAINQNLT